MPRRSPFGLTVPLGLFFGLLGLTSPAVLDARGQETIGAALTRAEGRALLSRIESWGCQYQNIDPKRIADSSLDLIVIDPILDGATGRPADLDDVALMQRKRDGGRRLVFAYLSIGAAEEYRPYWNPTWLVDKPAWLGSESPDWARSHSVKYWHPDWERIVADTLGRIAAAGFDGAFLDRVDAYSDWRDTRPASLDDMADFVVRLAEAARAKQPGFLLIGQNAEPLLLFDRYSSVIDGVSKESLLTGLQGQDTENRFDQIAWSMDYLSQAQRNGLTILSIEYLTTPSTIATARSRHRALGFKLFVGEKLLDRLP